MKNCFKKIIVLILTGVLVFSLCGCELFDTQKKAPDPAVYIYQPEITLTVGGAVRMAAATNDNATVGWLSLNEKIATVNDDGLITGIDVGETTVMAVTATGASALCTVKVTAAPQSDNKNPDDDPNQTEPPDDTENPSGKDDPSEVGVITLATVLSVDEGVSVSLTATLTNITGDVNWISSNNGVATAVAGADTKTATVTGISAGTATITASAGGKSATCTVTVIAKPQSVALNKSALSVDEGASVSLTATLTNITGNVVWTSSNNGIATVVTGADTKTATVTGISAGVATITASAGSKSATCTVTVNKKLPAGSEKEGYSLIWYDEFEGNSLDATKWSYQTGVRDDYKGESGPWFWGNNELQYYTQDSVTVSGGSLVITATKRNMDNDRTYKSGRILTRDKASWTYGYFEARMKLPLENGAWPAFWMLPQPDGSNGTHNEYGGWAANGELDIMEAKCRKQNEVLGTAHYGGAWPENKHTGGARYFSDSTIGEWHKYAVEWTADYIKWYVDDNPFYTLKSETYYSTASNSQSAPFDKPFYILFNLAVDSGSFDTEANATFNSARMEVDYVRVYKKTA